MRLAWWALVRVAALAVLGAVGLLLVGQGGLLVDALDRVLGVVGAADGLSGAGAEVSPQATVAGLAAGVMMALARPADRVIDQLVTLLHELGHTVVAAALGARPAGIVIRHDASGHATARWVGRQGLWRRLALALVAFAGVPAAGAASVAGGKLLLVAGPQLVLWGFAAVGVVVAALARSAWSQLVAVCLAGLALAGLHDTAEPWIAGAVVAVLAATAVEATFDSLRALGRPLGRGDDARTAARCVRLPASVIRLVQAAAAIAFGVWTVWLLVLDVGVPPAS